MILLLFLDGSPVPVPTGVPFRPTIDPMIGLVFILLAYVATVCGLALRFGDKPWARLLLTILLLRRRGRRSRNRSRNGK